MGPFPLIFSIITELQPLYIFQVQCTKDKLKKAGDLELLSHFVIACDGKNIVIKTVGTCLSISNEISVFRKR